MKEPSVLTGAFDFCAWKQLLSSGDDGELTVASPR
jgi:hypothetical protein